MTNELEKQFFDTFGIEQKKEYYCPSCDTKLEEWKTEKGLYYMCGNCCECDYVLDSLDEEFEEILKNLSYRTKYPQITDTHYLQLLCLLAKGMGTVTFFKDQDINNIKDTIVYGFIIGKEYFTKQQVQALFKEG